MRTVVLVAALVALAGPALAEERVLYCTETASAGFIWDEGQTEGRRTAFAEKRFVMKVLSETKRTVTASNGVTAGSTEVLTCRPPFSGDLLACDDGTGTAPWLFNGNKFVRAYMLGTPVGGSVPIDPNILVSYGTCTGF